VDFEVSALDENGPALGACAAAVDALLMTDDGFAVTKPDTEREAAHG
jgi:hypothetical protein